MQLLLKYFNPSVVGSTFYSVCLFFEQIWTFFFFLNQAHQWNTNHVCFLFVSFQVFLILFQFKFIRLILSLFQSVLLRTIQTVCHSRLHPSTFWSSLSKRGQALEHPDQPQGGAQVLRSSRAQRSLTQTNSQSGPPQKTFTKNIQCQKLRQKQFIKGFYGALKRTVPQTKP